MLEQPTQLECPKDAQELRMEIGPSKIVNIYIVENACLQEKGKGELEHHGNEH